MSRPRAGSHGREETDAAFPLTTTSWYFLDAVDVIAPEDVVVVVCFGDSITDGTDSTLNGDDRWPDVLSRRLHEAYGAGVVGGQRRHRRQPRRVSGLRIRPRLQRPGGRPPSSVSTAMSPVCRASTAVIWLEGINDLSGGAQGGCGHRRHAGNRQAQPRSRPEDLRRRRSFRASAAPPRMAHPRPTPSVRPSTRSSVAPGR